ncbi:MAG TPA: alpha/beta hydrolase [Acidimicrobiia bacterium]
MTSPDFVDDVAREDRRALTVELPDGRRLGYAEWGDPEGWPVLFFHGTPSSRLGLEWAEDRATDHGARVLSLDRPGHGLSDFAPGRTLLDWTRDVSAFADLVGLDTFAVAGWSGGGPYVLACASEIRDRLTAAAVLSGCGPLDTRAARRSSSDLDRPLLTLSTRAPAAAHVLLNSVVALARRAPRLAVIGMLQDMSRRDREVFRRITPDASSAVAFFLEAVRSGTDGVVDDYRVLASPWGFAPEGIEMPVHFWHGDADRLVALEQVRALAERIPAAELTVLPGEGHMLLVEHLDDVLVTLAP